MRQAFDIAVSQTAAMILLRIVPFLAYVVLRRGGTRWARFAGLSALGCGIALCAWAGPSWLGPPLTAAASLAYFAALASGTHWLARRLDRDAASRPLLLIALASAYVFVPGTIVPGTLGFTVQVIGWEMMLSSYSYVLEVERGGRDTAGWRDVWFFILIDPTLVYVQRAQPTAGHAEYMSGVRRCALGIGAMFLHHASFGLVQFVPWLIPVPLDRIVGVASYARFVTYYGVRFFAGYAVHSGLASLQIGCMRLLGYRVAERYHYPFLARDISDFWRRWNTYVGDWARRYVFTPVALKARRSFRSVPPAAARALALVLTFATIGAAHDLTQWTQHRVLMPATLIFVLHAFLVAFSVAVDSIHQLRSARWQARSSALISRVLLWHALILSLWFAIPTMSGQGFDAPITELRRALVGAR